MHIAIAFVIIFVVAFVVMWCLNAFANAMGARPSASEGLGGVILVALLCAACGSLMFGGLWSIFDLLSGSH